MCVGMYLSAIAPIYKYLTPLLHGCSFLTSWNQRTILIILFATIIACDSHQLKTSNKHLASIYFHEEKKVRCGESTNEDTIIVNLITLYQNVVQ